MCNVIDLDGLGSIEHGSQLLSDHRRLEKAAYNISRSPEVSAGKFPIIKLPFITMFHLFLTEIDR